MNKMSKWRKVKAVYVEIVGEDWSLKTVQKLDIELSGEVDILQLQKDLKTSIVSTVYNFKHRIK